MVYMAKRDLLAMTHIYLAKLDEDGDAYRRFCDLMLTMMGVSGPGGELTEEYRDSPMWEGGEGGEPLRPSVRADIARSLSPDLWHLLYPGGKR